MLKRPEIVRFALSCAAFAIASSTVVAQPSAGTDQDSCRRFAQAFYDWYGPLTLKRLKGPASDIALQQKPDAFAPELLRALKTDSEAQARASGDIVGLDFDPFVGGQDPADRYEARRVTLQGDTCSVEIWPVWRRGTSTKSAKPDAVAQLIRARASWRFTNFVYPDVNANLKDVLSQLAQERKH